MAAKRNRLDQGAPKLTFGKKVLEFNRWLKSVRLHLPEEVELLVPFRSKEVWRVNELFYEKYYQDYNERTFLFGINPGRLGAGLTGIPFTDPVNLSSRCGIDNDLLKKAELSSDFIYRMIEASGEIATFYGRFFITSVCPLGFIKKGINMNYYDDRNLLESVEPFIHASIRKQLEFGCRRDVAFVIGEGKNMDILGKWNQEHKFFDSLIPLPHPRFIMQYRRKSLQEYIALYLSRLSETSG